VATYTISRSAVAAPTFNLEAGSYGPPQAVTLADATSGATIYFTQDGSTPTASSPNYWQPIYVGHTQTIKAIAIVGASSSAVVTATYTIGASVAATIGAVLPTPTFSIPTGTYSSAQTVSIKDTSAAATIYYLTNVTPTWVKYTGPITVSATETVQAMAIATGYTSSAAATANYTISNTVAAPTFSLAGGAYGPPQALLLADATAGAVIHFTQDGSTPTASSPNFWEPIYVGHKQTIKAIAIVPGSGSSVVVSVSYTIGATQ
jgi:hypothetical protein